MRSCLQLLLALPWCLLAPGVAAAAPTKTVKPFAPNAGEPVDIAPLKANLKVLSDGQGHFVVLKPFGPHDHTYYGDGKTFHALRVGSSSASGDESFSFTFWEPRVQARYQAAVEFRDGGYSVQCADRITKLSLVPDGETQAMLEQATFYPPRWKHEAYALARDNRGTYFFVDHQREPPGNRVFRVYRGPRGKMKPLKMVNVVSDSEGEIFATKAGDLRLILDKKESSWVKGKANTKLVSLDLYDNVVLIYTDLGPYLGQRLGTPCDDL